MAFYMTTAGAIESISADNKPTFMEAACEGGVCTNQDGSSNAYGDTLSSLYDVRAELMVENSDQFSISDTPSEFKSKVNALIKDDMKGFIDKVNNESGHDLFGITTPDEPRDDISNSESREIFELVDKGDAAVERAMEKEYSQAPQENNNTESIVFHSDTSIILPEGSNVIVQSSCTGSDQGSLVASCLPEDNIEILTDKGDVISREALRDQEIQIAEQPSIDPNISVDPSTAPSPLLQV